MSNILSIIIVAVLGILGNITYFEYRLRKEHRKETIKEQLTKLLMPLYIILQTDELIKIAYGKNENLDFSEYESDKPDRLIMPIKEVLGKNLYLADDELHIHSLLFLKWAYGEDSKERFEKLHLKGYNALERDSALINFRKVVYEKYKEQKNKYLR